MAGAGKTLTRKKKNTEDFLGDKQSNIHKKNTYTKKTDKKQSNIHKKQTKRFLLSLTHIGEEKTTQFHPIFSVTRRSRSDVGQSLTDG